MGGGFYSSTGRATRTATFMSRSTHENFKERTMNLAMNPNGITLRESRDSEEHPNSLGIMIGLDVTGSMLSIPQYLVGKGLPTFMDNLINGGIKDPQVLFTGIGDHIYDQAPLQVGQFESSDDLLDVWLTKLYLEGQGGSNYGESYMLAWFFGAKYVEMDCLEKRNQKGFMFTIGDEPVLTDLHAKAQREIMGDGQYANENSLELLEMAREKFHVYHLHMKQGVNGTNRRIMDGWKQIMGDNLIIVERKSHVSKIMADIIIKEMGIVPVESIGGIEGHTGEIEL